VKLSKTAAMLLKIMQEKAANPGYYTEGPTTTATWGVDRGPHGGAPRAYGAREHAAAVLLTRLGLAEAVGSPRSHQDYRGGYASTHSALTLRMTDKGAAVNLGEVK
jgi:hypothetical protein